MEHSRHANSHAHRARHGDGREHEFQRASIEVVQSQGQVSIVHATDRDVPTVTSIALRFLRRNRESGSSTGGLLFN